MLFKINGTIDTGDENLDVEDFIDEIEHLIEEIGDFEFTGTISPIETGEEE